MSKAIDDSKVIDNFSRFVILMRCPESAIIPIENCIPLPILPLDNIPTTLRRIRHTLEIPPVADSPPDPA